MEYTLDNIKIITFEIIKLFLKIFLPLISIVIVFSFLYYSSIKNTNITALKQNEIFRVGLQNDAFQDEFKKITSDLMVLSSHRELSDATNGLFNLDLEDLEYEVLVFSRSTDAYDQIRLLDHDGMEMIRVNFIKGKPELVNHENLQFKGDRYYFIDTISLDKNEIFVSPFDLNVEGSEIEIPYKPTIRFGMPVFDLNGKKQGVIILNYLGKKLLNKLEKSAFINTYKGHDILVNSDGYFLRGIAEIDEWGFMFNERKDKKFENIFSEASIYINQNKNGQILTREGLFTFDTLYPLYEGLKSSTGTSEAFGKSVKKLQSNEYYWKAISFVPHKVINNLTSQLRNELIIFNSLFLVIIGISCWSLSKSIINRQRAEKILQKLAHFDMLTGLPNRKMLFDRMKIALANAIREERPLYVLFIDLDGFKIINDEMGHDAGDHVLIEVGKRLQSCIRSMDTVARIGGDEFVMVIKSEDDQKKIDQVANRVISILAKPIYYNGIACSVGCSIGIASYPKDGDTNDMLLTKADAVMYKVKKSGKNSFQYAE